MSLRSRRLTILVAGMVAGTPGQGGATWAVLQYLLGLRRLGHRVVFVETVHTRDVRPPFEVLSRSQNARFAEAVMDEFGFGSDWALVRSGRAETAGMSREALLEVAGTSDLLLNLGGTLTHEPVIERVPHRVFVDLDPGFTQIWHEDEGLDMGFDAHDHFVTVGLAVGQVGCPIPTAGRKWFTSLPPVVLASWLPEHDVSARWTTVANWRSYGTVNHKGLTYGQKAHSWRDLVSVPARTGEAFEIALAIDPNERDDVASLRSNGWRLVDPANVAGTPDSYRRFVRQSKAEIAVAKSGYVHSRSGWFSDRSACYLSCGLPVVAQDTGFGRFLPTGEGLVPFATLLEACDAVNRVSRDYPTHRRAARRLAEELFDSDRVLTALLDQVGALS